MIHLLPIVTRRALFVLLATTLFDFPGSAVAESPTESSSNRTPLDEYVAEPDPSYSWRVDRAIGAEGFTTYFVDMKSQTWRTAEEVDRTLWQHWLVVVKPDDVSRDTAFLLIGGGSNDRGRPGKPDDLLVKIALATGSVVAELKTVPNQPLVFHSDGQRRFEDDLLGYTWNQYLKTGDVTWPGQLPMVKSAVRAMDTVQSLLASVAGEGAAVDKFVVAGASKRGWTTWLTAAVDPRVLAIVPIVIDMLNVDHSMRHHHAAYGFWAPAIDDYVQHGIMDRIDAPELQDLRAFLDPFSYRRRLTMPKCIVNSAGDQFFLPDSSQFYFDRLQGEKYLRYVPNTDHSLDDSDAAETITAFYQMILAGMPRPEVSWTCPDDGSIRVRTRRKPRQVTLWQATNPDARDFRLRSIGKSYTSRSLEDRGGGRYVAKVKTPERGWTAFFVELVYDTGTKLPLKLTTEVRVVPDTLPYADEPVADGSHLAGARE